MAPSKPKAGHVNMMADTNIANLPVEGLRAVMRGILANRPDCTPIFEEQTKNYLEETASKFSDVVVVEQTVDGPFRTTPSFQQLRKRICCMVGCGLCYQAIPLLQSIVEQVSQIKLSSDQSAIVDEIAGVDGDIIQAITAVQKTLFVETGSRQLSETERQPLEALLKALMTGKSAWETNAQPFVLERGLEATIDLVNPSLATAPVASTELLSEKPPGVISETFEMAGIQLPRLFSGLWQLSSPAWGIAPRSRIMQQFSKHVGSGLTAFDMADHYGDAEILFGQYRSASNYSDSLFAATKYCVFHPMTVTPEAIRAKIDERCQRLRTDKLDLLQFHWQFYNDPQYIDAMKYLQQDSRVKHLGLCNFDTEHMEKAIESGVKIYTNQVQFSLIDSRPTVKMVEFCNKNNIKLLTYGTLLGGLLAEKWVGKEAPDLYAETMTPSLRKYFAMIQNWGGWPLFQELLHTLQKIGRKHNVSVSNVATRWVLDFPCVGAVIVGARMGVSEQSQENLASLGWSLDADDQVLIQAILDRSSRAEMFESLGDCGGEYR
ncbi:hypothetical protein N7499_001915 [Penicillium canescens]|uniref:NADP-dependent oxidoreductase domain-containing protein n=1 Tax=Penicillium canescens TaxID=5083 RepID=A0AAD6I7K4_PENCN|nr:uncharacterized protein N7446_009449 [Penicillium canescens]KAJ6002220.1 hypothetical protein N7522_007447 [Penicillium canescens]KAJ6034695.1 hypothetical protein N7460_008870 [Penicillium canescens]KAJ6046357.1 hypothetical protein N7444_007611 [Penicillium canescens]KAJ6053437.1 hypothetical protein N7446_009449 [Penicillium canescens]KAJ6097541.1 hypothetical protein N7499_001915 [Penicillium canescens]